MLGLCRRASDCHSTRTHGTNSDEEEGQTGDNDFGRSVRLITMGQHRAFIYRGWLMTHQSGGDVDAPPDDEVGLAPHAEDGHAVGEQAVQDLERPGQHLCG